MSRVQPELAQKRNGLLRRENTSVRSNPFDTITSSRNQRKAKNNRAPPININITENVENIPTIKSPHTPLKRNPQQLLRHLKPLPFRGGVGVGNGLLQGQGPGPKMQSPSQPRP